MATVDKTWVFASDNEGLVDVGDSAVTLVHDTGGNPGGSLEFTGNTTGITERARRASTGETWETWGVPAGATVTSVQVVSWDDRKYDGTSRTIRVRIRTVDSAGTIVHAAGDIADTSRTAANDAGWQSHTGVSQTVDVGKQASTTDVRLEVQFSFDTVLDTLDFGLDNVLLRITYTAGAATKAPSPPRRGFPLGLLIR